MTLVACFVPVLLICGLSTPLLVNCEVQIIGLVKVCHKEITVIMAIKSVTLLVTLCLTQQLHLSVESAMIRKWYDTPLYNDPEEVEAPELDDSMPRVLSPSVIEDDGLPPISPPSSPHFTPTQTYAEQYFDYSILSSVTTYNQPMTITPPPIAADFTLGQSAAQPECTPWAWGCNIYYQVRCR